MRPQFRRMAPDVLLIEARGGAHGPSLDDSRTTRKTWHAASLSKINGTKTRKEFVFKWTA